MKKVYIMRGISGSGKSTYIKNNFSGAIVCSADNYFIDNGKYNYDPKLIAEAHKDCFRNFLFSLKNEFKEIAVDNVNSLAWQISPYIILAECYRYETEIIEISIDPNIAAKRNQHGVSEKAIKGMMYAMKQLLPKTWKVTKVQAVL
jgi:predicted kinase